MNTGTLIISLDFELLWGVFDKVDPLTKLEYFDNTRKIIPSILDLFIKNDIHCTWAVVGMLFNKDWHEWGINTPANIPNYSNKDLSAYQFGNKYKTEGIENMVFASNLVDLIKNTANQEIGTHTYSHYYCLENGQDLETFQLDLEKSIELAKNRGIQIKSLVFPRNQFNSKYLNVCYDLGIKNVRSNPENWYWDDTSKGGILKKIFRTGDAYLGTYDKLYLKESIKYKEGQPLAQKASRLLRPSSYNKIINNLKLTRIKNEMEYAAKNNEVYHLWWHPHNFGNDPESNLLDLQEIIEYYSYCNKKYKFQSKTMEELGDDFFNSNKKLNYFK